MDDSLNQTPKKILNGSSRTTGDHWRKPAEEREKENPKGNYAGYHRCEPVVRDSSPKTSFFLGLLGGIAVVSVIGFIILGIALAGVLKDKGQTSGQVANSNANQAVQTVQPQATVGPETEAVTAQGIATFSQKKGAEICREDGKPAVYLFSTTGCPHCQWIKDTFDKTVKEYVGAGKIKAYHWDLDTNDNTLTSAVETAVPGDHLAIYEQFNPRGTVPTFVIGCKYFRVGTGYESKEGGASNPASPESLQNLAKEEAEFRAVIGDLLK